MAPLLLFLSEDLFTVQGVSPLPCFKPKSGFVRHESSRKKCLKYIDSYAVS